MTYYDKVYVIAQQDVDGYTKILKRDREELTGYAWTESIDIVMYFVTKQTAELYLEELIKSKYISNDCFIKNVEIRYRW